MSAARGVIMNDQRKNYRVLFNLVSRDVCIVCYLCYVTKFDGVHPTVVHVGILSNTFYRMRMGRLRLITVPVRLCNAFT